MYYKIKLHTHAFMFEAVNNSMSISVIIMKKITDGAF